MESLIETSCAPPVVLGIDIGTSSVKMAVIEIQPKSEPVVLGTVCHSYGNQDSSQTITSEKRTDMNEQDVSLIIKNIGLTLKKLSPKLLRSVKHIAIAGQMHGVLGWNEYALSIARFIIEPEIGTTATEDFHQHCSNLVSWMDQRCSSLFLESLRKPATGPLVASGYGCATLMWFKKHQPTEFSDFFQAQTPELSTEPARNAAHVGINHLPWRCAGTIADFVVCVLANLTRPIMSPQMAASWGYFDLKHGDWERDTLNAMDFPMHLLPNVVPTGTVVGNLYQSWYEIPANTTIYVAMGDLQCSAYEALRQSQTAVCNLSTSAQICFPVSDQILLKNYSSDISRDNDLSESSCGFQILPVQIETKHKFNCQLWPYFDDHTFLAVSASLNGGNVLSQFVKTLQSWTDDLGLGHLDMSKMFERLNTLSRSEESDALPKHDLIIIPTLFGERHCPGQFLSIHQIQAQNLGLGSVYRRLCQAVICNLTSMVPKQLLLDCQIKRLVCSGGLVAQNPWVIQTMAKQFPELEVLSNPLSTDACVGASLFVADLHK